MSGYTAKDSPVTYWAWRVTGWVMCLTGLAIMTAGWTQGWWLQVPPALSVNAMRRRMSGDITTHLGTRTGRLRITVTEMDNDGLNTIQVSMPAPQAQQFARTISEALDRWEASR